jgi:multiple sugar transport system ATP-binding protein
MPLLSIQKATVRYDNRLNAIDELCLDVNDGELFSVLGPSGSGKTTLLRAIAGLEKLSAGTIRLGDRVLNGIPPRQRNVAMVFQQPALYPHLSVRENIGFPLRMRGAPQKDIDEHVRSVAALVKIDALLDRRPHQLSGGQAQRVALARALVWQPQCLLLDEPFSNLDATLRAELRTELCSLHESRKITTLYVTHDMNDAAIANRLAFVVNGRVEYCGVRDEFKQQ